jgi:DNA polymerase-1
MQSVKDFALKNGYTETLFGRKRMFPGINSKIPFIRSMAERTATNAPIQGTATADVIKLAIRYAEEDLKNAGILDKASIVLQIHDELVYEIDESVLDQATEIILKAMQELLIRSFLHFKTEIPLSVHFGAGNNLGEVK